MPIELNDYINGLTEDTSPDVSADFVLTRDTSATALKKVKPSNILGTNLSDIRGLADPNADRILFWDDSAGAWAFLTVGSGLSISGTTLSATGGGTIDGSGSAGRAAFWTDADTLSSSADFTWDDTNKQLKITSSYASGGLFLQGGPSDYFPIVLTFKTQGYNQTANWVIGQGDGGGGVGVRLYLGANAGDYFGVADIAGNSAIKLYAGNVYGTATKRAWFKTYTVGTIGVQIELEASQTADAFQVLSSGGSDLFIIDKNGTPGIKVTTAPADGDIDSGQVFIYFDSTNGAAKLKIKGKQADGTVRTGEVALS